MMLVMAPLGQSSNCGYIRAGLPQDKVEFRPFATIQRSLTTLVLSGVEFFRAEGRYTQNFGYWRPFE